MEEKTLLHISIAGSLLGILILFIISNNIEIPEANIYLVNKSMLNENIKIKGQITNIIETPGLYILTVSDKTDKIQIVVFKEDKLDIKVNQIVEIQGKVSQYKNQTEIIADKIIIFS